MASARVVDEEGAVLVVGARGKRGGVRRGERKKQGREQAPNLTRPTSRKSNSIINTIENIRKEDRRESPKSTERNHERLFAVQGGGEQDQRRVFFKEWKWLVRACSEVEKWWRQPLPRVIGCVPLHPSQTLHPRNQKRAPKNSSAFTAIAPPMSSPAPPNGVTHVQFHTSAVRVRAEEPRSPPSRSSNPLPFIRLHCTSSAPVFHLPLLSLLSPCLQCEGTM